MYHLSPKTTEPGEVTIVVRGPPTVRKPRALIGDSSSDSSSADKEDDDAGDDADTVEVSANAGEREGPGDGDHGDEGEEEQDEDELKASKDYLFTVLARKRMASPAITAVLTQADRIERHLHAVQQ
ncbi:hypothetical protein HK101_004555, partial [Irineochytrium annulatum]